MNIVVTGVTGYVGGILVPKILAKKEEMSVLLVSRNISKAKDRIPESRSVTHLAIENPAFDEQIKAFSPDVAIHLASLLTAQNDPDTALQILDANIGFGTKLLQALSGTNLATFINTGTFAEYRFGTDELRSAYLYSATKTAFRSIVKYYSDLCGFGYVNVIPYTIYGPARDTKKKVIDYLFDSLGAKEPMRMTEGEQVLDFIHLDDVCDFYLRLLERHNDSTITNGETFFLGSGIGTSIRDLCTKIESIAGKTANIDWGKLPYRDMDVMRAVAAVEKNSELLGWTPSVSLQCGLEAIWNAKKESL